MHRNVLQKEYAQECITKSKTEIALNMLSEGLQHDFISRMTGLSLDDVLKLSTH